VSPFVASVVIPTHNRAGLLPRAVRSALRAATGVEVIVVDDASTDETPDVCAKLEGIRYIRLDRNAGPAEARNVGIRESSSEYVAFCDDDDALLPGGVERLIAALESEPTAGFAYGRAIFGRCDGDVWTGRELPRAVHSGDVYWHLLTRNPIFTNAVVVRRSHALAVGLFDPNIPLCEDWHLWIRLAERYPVCSVDAPVAGVRAPDTLAYRGSLSSNRASTVAWGVKVQQWGLDLPRGLAASHVKRFWLRERFVTRAFLVLSVYTMQALLGGDVALARRTFAEALRLRFFG
jgi:glycosyltransferase involved in cell wall biosynthesis